jgi:hypothetical protein
MDERMNGFTNSRINGLLDEQIHELTNSRINGLASRFEGKISDLPARFEGETVISKVNGQEISPFLIVADLSPGDGPRTETVLILIALEVAENANLLPFSDKCSRGC